MGLIVYFWLHRSVMSHFLVFRFLSPSSSFQRYKVSDDEKAESEDDFLKRMGGLVRLYAAIIQTQVAIFGAGVSHPHGLERGWMWLARVLNKDPHPSITATALCEFLEVHCISAHVCVVCVWVCEGLCVCVCVCMCVCVCVCI